MSDRNTLDSKTLDNKSASQLYESLSALIDNEVSELELHRILAESEQDPEVRSRWHRYQIASAALRQDYKVEGFVDISSSVRTAIATLTQDPVVGSNSDHASIDLQNSGVDVTASVDVSNASEFRTKSWRAAAGRFAIAASVAGMVLVGAQQMNLVAFNAEPSAGQLAGVAPTSTNPTSVRALSSATGNAPVTMTTEDASNVVFTLPANNSTPVPMQVVSDGQTFIYQDRRQPQLRYQMQDPRVAEYDQMVVDYFNQLIMEHAENAATNGSSSLLPYARVPEDVETK